MKAALVERLLALIARMETLIAVREKPPQPPQPVNPARVPPATRELTDVEQVQRDFARLRGLGLPEVHARSTFDRETRTLHLQIRDKWRG